MSIPVTCVCGKQLAVKENMAGKRVRCSRCGSFLVVPQLRAAPAKPAEASARAKEPLQGLAKLRQQGWFWPAAAGAILLLIGGGVGWYSLLHKPAPAVNPFGKQAPKKAGPRLDGTEPETPEPGSVQPPKVKRPPVPPVLVREPRGPRRLLADRHVGELASAEDQPASVGGLALSPDGQLLLANGCLWEAATGRRLRQLVQPGDGFWFWGFTKDGKHAFGVAQGGENTFRLRRLDNGQDIRSFRLHAGSITYVSLSADGRLALVAHAHDTAPEVHLWDVEQGQHLRAFVGHGPRTIFQALFAPDERHVLTCGEDKTLRLWDVNTSKQVRRFDRHTGPVVGGALSADGKQLLSASWDGTVRLWNAQDGQEVRSFDGPGDDRRPPELRPAQAVAFAVDGKQALSGGADRTVRLWDVATGKEVRRFLGHTAGIWHTAFAPEGRRALSSGAEGTVRWHDTVTGKEIRRLGEPAGWASQQQAFYPDFLQPVAMTFGREGGNPAKLTVLTEDPARRAEGFYFALGGLFDQHIHLWDQTARGQERRYVAGFCGQPGRLSVSADARLLFSDDTGSLRLGDLYTGANQRRLPSAGAELKCVAFAPDARHALAGYANGLLRLWDVDKGGEARTYSGLASWVDGVAISPLNNQFISFGGKQDFSLRLWGLHSGQQSHRLEGHTNVVTGVAYAPDGKRLASVSRLDRSLRWWDLEGGQQLQCVFHGADDPDSSNCVAWSPDGRYLAVGGTQGPVRLLEAELGKEIRRFQGLSGLVQAVVFAPDGRLVAAGGANGLIVAWDTDSGVERRRFDRHQANVCSLQFAPEGQFLVSGSEDKKAYLWELDPRQLMSYQGHTSRVECVAIAPDGRSLLSGGRDKTVRLWELATGELLQKFDGHTDTVWCVAFAPAAHLIASGGGDQKVRLWDEKSGKMIRVLEGHAAAVTALAFSRNGRFLLTGSADKVAILWDLLTYKELDRIDGSPEAVSQTEARSLDGPYVMSADLYSHVLYYWDLKNSKEGPLFLRGHGDRVTCVALSPGQKYALSGSRDQTLRLWDLAAGKEVRQLEGHEDHVVAVAFSADGRRALSAGADKIVRLWDVEAGKEVRKLEGHGDRVTCVAFSADSRRAVSGSADKTVRVWNLDNGQPLHKLEGHVDTVLGVAFAADGNQVLSGGRDRTARVWEARTGKPLRQFQDDLAIIGVAFAPDGRSVLLRGADGAGRRWDLGSGTLVEVFPAPLPRLGSAVFVGEGKQLAPARLAPPR